MEQVCRTVAPSRCEISWKCECAQVPAASCDWRRVQRMWLIAPTFPAGDRGTAERAASFVGCGLASTPAVVVGSTTLVVEIRCSQEQLVTHPRLSRLEMRVMETLWSRGTSSIREIQESFPEKSRPAYTTIQTTVYRLEEKQVVRRVKKIGNFHVFEATVSRESAQRRLVDDLLAILGGRPQPVMAHMIEAGKLTLEDVQEAERMLRDFSRKEKA